MSGVISKATGVNNLSPMKPGLDGSIAETLMPCSGCTVRLLSKSDASCGKRLRRAFVECCFAIQISCVEHCALLFNTKIPQKLCEHHGSDIHSIDSSISIHA